MSYANDIAFQAFKMDTFFLFRNLDIRDAILQLLNVIRDGNKKMVKHQEESADMGERVSQHEFYTMGQNSSFLTFLAEIAEIWTYFVRNLKCIDIQSNFDLHW